MKASNRNIAICAAVSCAALISACAPTQMAATPDPEWEAIFDGVTLEGWTPKVRGAPAGENFNEIFRVRDGVLAVSFDEQAAFDDRFGHLFYDVPVSHYKLRLDYRFIGEQAAGGPAWAKRNSGVMLHTQSPATMGLDQAFPVSVEAQFLGDLPEEQPGRTTGNVCTPGTHIHMDGALVTDHCIASQMPARPAGEWVRFEAEVCGAQSIRLFVNGEMSFELTEPQFDPEDGDAAQFIGSDLAVRQGYFALQAESHPLEMRDIELVRLTPETCGDAAPS
ncbi:MAG: DUF1080 domain-containing protein [Henriciella sp.]|nr:DUF1080 domain-containing protein [Henriciella sp.]